MKTIINQSVTIVLLVFCMATVALAADELIPPTRMLTDSNDANGYLSIFSEPPGLKVYLDGSMIGVTPLFALTVKAGTHRLKINDKETKVIVSAGESRHISLHKDTFVDSTPKMTDEPEKKEEIPVGTTKTKTEPRQARKEKQKPKDPLYWPLNPEGPIE